MVVGWREYMSCNNLIVEGFNVIRPGNILPGKIEASFRFLATVINHPEKLSG